MTCQMDCPKEGSSEFEIEGGEKMKSYEDTIDNLAVRPVATRRPAFLFVLSTGEPE